MIRAPISTHSSATWFNAGHSVLWLSSAAAVLTAGCLVVFALQVMNRPAAVTATVAVRSQLDAYMDLRRRISDTMGPLHVPLQPVDILARERALGAAMKAARPEARRAVRRLYSGGNRRRASGHRRRLDATLRERPDVIDVRGSAGTATCERAVSECIATGDSSGAAPRCAPATARRLRISVHGSRSDCQGRGEQSDRRRSAGRDHTLRALRTLSDAPTGASSSHQARSADVQTAASAGIPFHHAAPSLRSRVRRAAVRRRSSECADTLAGDDELNASVLLCPRRYSVGLDCRRDFSRAA